jgi:NAD(P)-dependent dehydrogenase (short-subunit alcohol dehydrogenase family)
LTQTTTLFENIRPRYPEFQGQVALVTGSSRGIGKGIALRLGREGMNLVLHGLDAAEVDATTAEFQALGVQAVGVCVNFADADATEQLFEAVQSSFGTLDLLVNNAADLRRTHFEQADAALLDHQLAVNLRVPYLCALRAAEIMRPKQRGSVISVSSVGGLRAHWSGLPYDMTKGGIDAMTRSMAIELARHNVRVNAVAPGSIQIERSKPQERDVISARIPMARFGTPLEIGAAVAFLASDDAAYVTGQVLYVDGGITAQLSPPGQPI